MKRLALVAAALSLAGAGCIVSNGPPGPPPPQGVGTVNFYWQFVRTRLDGSQVTYDPVTGTFSGSGVCAKSGVDTVQVQLPDGSTEQFPCVYQGVQGFQLTSWPAGPQTFTFTGLRGGVALYYAQQTVNVVVATATNVDVSLPGVTGALDVIPVFSDAFGNAVSQWSTCSGAGVSTLTYNLVDSAGTEVATGSIPCTGSGVLSFTGGNVLDLDAYTIRMQGFIGTSSVESFDSATTVVSARNPTACAAPAFNHLGQNDTANAGWFVTMYDTHANPTICQ